MTGSRSPGLIGKMALALVSVALLPLVVSFSAFLDETAAAADFVLPASLAHAGS